MAAVLLLLVTLAACGNATRDADESFSVEDAANLCTDSVTAYIEDELRQSAAGDVDRIALFCQDFIDQTSPADQ